MRPSRFEPSGTDGLDEAERLACEFLGYEGATSLARSFVSHPDLVIVCGDESSRIVGVCFGSPRSDDEAGVGGIAISADRAGKGLGSRLLRRFEDACRERGYKKVSVGSAEGCAERFYLKNGDRPIEYYIKLDREPAPESLEGSRCSG